MEQAGLTRMIKVEVVIEAEEAADVEALLRSEGVTGWTGLTGLTGVGHGGRHEGRLLFNERGGQTMLVAVLPRDRLDGVVAGLTELFRDRHGVMFVSETWVSRPAYFS